MEIKDILTGNQVNAIREQLNVKKITSRAQLSPAGCDGKRCTLSGLERTVSLTGSAVFREKLIIMRNDLAIFSDSRDTISEEISQLV